MLDVKTPNKRKSLGPTENSAKKGKSNANNSFVKSPKPQNNNTPSIKHQNSVVKVESPDSPNVSISKKDKKIKSFEGTTKNKLNDSKSDKVTKISDNGKIKRERKARHLHLKVLAEKVTSKDPAALQDIKEKIVLLLARATLSKTAKRKLGTLRRLELEAEGKTPVNRSEIGKTPKAKGVPNKGKVSGKKQDTLKEKDGKAGNKAAKSPNQANKQPKSKKAKSVPKPATEEESDDEEIEEIEIDEDDDDDDSDGGSSESDYVVEKKVKPAKVTKKMNTHLEQDSEEEFKDKADKELFFIQTKPDKKQTKPAVKKGQTSPEKIKKEKQGENKELDMKDLEKNNIVQKGQSRYVLFVGNVPFDVTKEELIEHFKKAGDIKHIRIPLGKGNDKPRGFVYVEVASEDVYQKALSLHHTMLRGRRINVLYTQSGKKKPEQRKKEIKLKNMKLHAMRKGGQLKGSVKQSQKRSFRRNKKKSFNKKEEGD